MHEIDFVFDRDYSDVEEAIRLKERIRSDGYNSLTDEEKTLWDNGLKACRNASDLNRIGYACSVIAGLLEIPMTVKTDWAKTDIPTSSDTQWILDNVQTLKNSVSAYTTDMPNVPSNPINTIKKMNDVEKILYKVYTVINIILTDMCVCGDTYICEDNRLI